MTQPALKSEASQASRFHSGLKSLLLVGVRKQAVESLVPALRRRAVELVSTKSADAALVSCRQRRYDLIVLREPLADLPFEAFLEAIRRPGSPCEHTYVQVISPPERLEQMQERVSRLTGVCSMTDFGGLMATVSRVILGIAARVEARLMVELTATLANRKVSRFCQVINVSKSGVLVRSADLLPVGERLGVALSVPGSALPLRMQARVARHTKPHEMTGFALEIKRFEGGARRAWADYVDGQLAREDTRPLGQLRTSSA